jgi:hypothetical protein
VTTQPPGRGLNAALASLTALLVVADIGLAILGLTVWNAQRHGHLSAAQAATFIVVGASAAVGALVLLLALVALAGVPGPGLARLTSGLAWVRLAAVIAALFVVAVVIGISAIVGLVETFMVAVALFDAGVAVFVTGIAVRRSRHG